MDHQISWIHNDLINYQNSQFNTAILIGTLLSGSFGALFISAARSIYSAEFLQFLPFFTSMEVGFAALVFILLSSIYYFYANFFPIFKIIKIFKLAKTKDLEILADIKKIEFPELFHAYKPFIIMGIFSFIAVIIPFLSYKEHEFGVILLLVGCLFLLIEIIFQYRLFSKRTEKAEMVIKTFYNLLGQVKNSQFNKVGKKAILKEILKLNSNQKLGLLVSILIIFLSLMIWMLPSIFTICISTYLLYSFINLLEKSLLLVSIVAFFQIILIYPITRYYYNKVNIDILNRKQNALLEIRKEVITNNRKTLKTYITTYKEYLEKLGYRSI